MIAIGTIAVIALIWLTMRQRAWAVCVLAIIVGSTIGGPIAPLVKVTVDGIETAAHTVDRVT